MEEDRLYGYDGPDTRREPVEEGLTPAEGLAGAGERPVNTEEGPANIEESRANAEESPANAEESRVTAEESPANAEKELANAEEPAAEDAADRYDTQNSGTGSDFHELNGYPDTGSRQYESWDREEYRQNDNWQQDNRERGDWQQDNRQQNNYQQPNYQQPIPQNSYYRDEYRQAANPAYTQPQKQSSMALASLIMGIIGIVTSCCCYGGVIFGSLGILFALLSKMGDTMEGYAKAGLITSIIALFLAAMAMIFLFGMMSSSLLSGGAF